MSKTLKQMTALALALFLIAGQVAIPTAADETGSEPTTVLVDVPSLPGGTSTEKVEVDIAVSTDANGNITAKAETKEGGDVTDSGNTVNYSSETVTDADGKVLSEDTSFDAISQDGSYMAVGGVETSTELPPVEETPEITVDLVDENGSLLPSASAGGESTSITTPTHEGDNLQSENPAIFDQTTVTTTERGVEVTVESAVVTSGDPVYLDENGDPLPSTDNGYNYFSGVSAGGTGYSVKLYTIIKDEEGNDVRVNVDSGGITEWQTKDETTGEYVDGLYCVDASISSKPYGYYRLTNLEDAVEEGYYTEEEAKHLRAIATNGYTWDSVNNSDNVNDVNELLYTAGILNKEAGEALDSKQAAAITQAAIWIYANRFPLDSGDLLPEFSGNGLTAEQNALMVKACTYLTTLTMDAPEDETQVINEEKFIEDMTFTVGSKVEDHADNQDNNQTNDVYHTTLKFSLVVTPDWRSDDLIVRVMDAQGNVVKSARIAGEAKEDEQFGYAKTETVDGKLYYVLDDMQLSENSNTTFNLKLEGHQMLTEGVYVFEAQNMDREQLEEALYHWGGQKRVDQYSTPYTDEELEAYGLLRSQNYITTMEGTAEVDVGMQIDLTFNVEEASVSTTRIWRAEGDPRPISDEFPTTTGYDGDDDVPALMFLPTNIPVPLAAGPEEEPMLEDADILTILDEEVPLADAPVTGDASILWGIMGMISLGSYSFLGKKKEEEN